MIEESQIIPLLLERCPKFESQWQKHHEFWGNKEAGIYNDLGEFAHFVVDSYAAGDMESVQMAFDAAETLLCEGHQKVKVAIAVGLIETIYTTASWRPFGRKVFLPRLGAESRRAWKEIEELWRGKSSLMDVIRAERLANRPPKRWYEFWKK